MLTLTGFVETTESGRVRVYSTERPRDFSEVDLEHVAGYDQTDDELVGTVRLNEKASVDSGQLDETDYQALFSAEARPLDNSPFYRETEFRLCYSWNPPGGGGYC